MKYKILPVLFFIPLTLFAGVTGKIAGKVIDKETGAPLPGVNVIIENTTMGAATNLNGEYFIINVPVGTYSVSASMIGYTTETKEDVKVSADLTTTLNFELKPTAIEMKAITVKAKKPLVKKDATATIHVVEGKQIDLQPVRSQDAIIVQQAGVVYSERGPTGGIHIRGGRADEVVYMVDGIPVMNALTGRRGANINVTAVEELSITTGGFNAEYGQAMSGVINLVTKEGRKFGGLIRSTSDKLGKIKGNEDRYELTIGGPFPLHKKLEYFFSGELTTRERSPAWENPFLKEYINKSNRKLAKGYYFNALPYASEYYSYQGKLTYKFTPGVKLNLSGFITRTQSEGGPIYCMPRYRTASFQKAYQLLTTLTHQITKSVFYSLKLGRFYTTHIWGKKDWRFEELRRPWEDYKMLPWWYDVPEIRGYYTSPGWYAVDEDSNYYYPYGVPSSQVGFGTYWPGHYVKRISSHDIGKFDIVYQYGTHHQFQSGIEVKNYPVVACSVGQYISTHFGGLRGIIVDTVNYHGKEYIDSIVVIKDTSITDTIIIVKDTIIETRKNRDLSNCLYFDRYEESPKEFSFYIQDKIEYPGFVFNVGCRFDWFNSNTWRFRDMLKPYKEEGGLDTIAVTPKYQISPRLGISFPVTERTVFHVAYGHFFQNPHLRWLYDGYNRPIIAGRGAWGITGNPDLGAQKTIQYEAGVGHQISPDVALHLTAFYKDIYNLIGTRFIPAIPNPYSAYVTEDYGNVKGVEISMTKRATAWLSGNFSYTLSFAEGTSSWEREAYYDYIANIPIDPYTGEPFVLPKTVYALEFDQRHVINLALNLDIPKGIKFIENTNINLITQIGSGLPYTERDTRGYIVGVTNAKRLPWKENTKIKIKKDLFVGGVNFYIFAEIFNLFNTKNIISVYEATGKPDDNGLLLDFSTYIEQSFPRDYMNAGKVPVYPVSPYPAADKRRDFNNDGYITKEEWYESYKLAYQDRLNGYGGNYSAPRLIHIGVAIGW